MHWYLVHTKPSQERSACQSLEKLGYECYLPELVIERCGTEGWITSVEPLFPRYLILMLATEPGQHHLSALRSACGVSRLVSDRRGPFELDKAVVDTLKWGGILAKEKPLRCLDDAAIGQSIPENVHAISEVYQMPLGQMRSMKLIEMLSTRDQSGLHPVKFRKVN